MEHTCRSTRKSAAEVKTLKHLNMDNMSSTKTLIRICMIAAFLVPTVNCQGTCDNAPMCQLDFHSLGQDALNSIKDGTLFYNENLGIFPQFKIIKPAIQQTFPCPSGFELQNVQSELKDEELCIPDHARHVCPNTASLELLKDPQSGMELLICRPTNSCRGDQNYYCKVHYSKDIEMVVQIVKTECQFGYTTNRRLRYMECKGDLKVAESKKFKDRAFCDFNNGYYNRYGNMYFNKSNENMKQCVHNDSHCWPDYFRPDGSCIQACPDGMAMSEDAGFNCSKVDGSGTVQGSSPGVHLKDEDSKHNEKCTVDEFRCHSDGKCIPKSARCNKTSECDDKSDEQDCQNEKCTMDEFTCHNDGKCIPKSARCNKTSECDDKSDEQDCQNEKCAVDEFRCHNDGKCIPKSAVCNNTSECDDKSDEQDCQNGNSTNWELIIGLSVCIVVLIILVVGIVYWCLVYRKKMKKGQPGSRLIKNIKKKNTTEISVGDNATFITNNIYVEKSAGDDVERLLPANIPAEVHNTDETIPLKKIDSQCSSTSSPLDSGESTPIDSSPSTSSAQLTASEDEQMDANKVARDGKEDVKINFEQDINAIAEEAKGKFRYDTVGIAVEVIKDYREELAATVKSPDQN